MTGYEFHPEARFDLDDIWEFIRADNLDAAERMIAEILAALTALAADEQPLWVVAVMHGRRSPRVMAAILRGRE
jgi:plasmid stabilization system protein ParE